MDHPEIKLLEVIVGALVGFPERIAVERSVDEMGVLLKLSIDPTDMGKVIGREGNTAKAIRTIMRTFGSKNNARINLKILDPEVARGGVTL